MGRLPSRSFRRCAKSKRSIQTDGICIGEGGGERDTEREKEIERVGEGRGTHGEREIPRGKEGEIERLKQREIKRGGEGQRERNLE